MKDPKTTNQRKRKAIFCLILLIFISLFVLLFFILPEIRWRKEIAKLQNAQIGDVISFGGYVSFDFGAKNSVLGLYQNNEWIVLDRQGDQILLQSNYTVNYITSDNFNSLWPVSDMNVWLNNFYYNAAFSSKEKNIIMTTICDCNFLEDWSWYSSSDSDDKVFLLSYDEYNKYFLNQTSAKRMSKATGSYESYWLRTAAKDAGYYMLVTDSGSLDTVGTSALQGGYIVPAIWIDISNL